MFIRNCAQCNALHSRSFFSRNQWDKGVGKSRCKACVDNLGSHYCTDCHEIFTSEEELKVHTQLHRSSIPACFFCDKKKTILAGTNILNQENTSFFNPVCSGKDRVYRRIYEFALEECNVTTFGNNVTKLGPEEGDSSDPVNLHCPECTMTLRHFRQLLYFRDEGLHRQLSIEQFCTETVNSTGFPLIK